jgi:palmitoyltransferase
METNNLSHFIPESSQHTMTPNAASNIIILDDVETDSLCYGEYINRSGNKTHIATCCCDCEDFDNLCTSICCGRSKSRRGKILSNALADIVDRMRIPWSGGARKLTSFNFNIDFVLSLIVIFVFLFVSTHSLIGTILCIFMMPVLLYIRFFTQRIELTKQQETTPKTKILFPFYLILNTLIVYFILFNLILKKDLNNEGTILYNLFIIGAIIIHITLRTIKPGFVKRNNTIPLKNVKYEDNYCSKCNLKRHFNNRIGHCPVCDGCIMDRDHHCFWVNNCIGYNNHQLFIFYILYLNLLFIYTFRLNTTFLGNLKCKFGVLWSSPIVDNESFSCLFDIYYVTFSHALSFVLTIQLVPIILYLTMLFSQQFVYISIGYTQYQLYKISQRNIRFSLVYFVGNTFSLKEMIKNWLNFVGARKRDI